MHKDPVAEPGILARKVGILVGMKAEARLIRPFFPQAPIAVSGATLHGAQAASERLVACGATLLLSFGLAAGLDPDLDPGTIVIARHVMVGGRRISADPSFCVWLGTTSPGIRNDDVLHSDVVVGSAIQKAELFKASACAALDMESGILALAADRAGLSFAVLRVICDPATRTLPHAAEIALDPQGGIGFAAMARELIRHPGQIGGMITLGQDAAHARKAMARFLHRRFPI